MTNLTPPSHPIGKLREAHAHLSKKVRFHTEQTAGAFQTLAQGIDELERFRSLFGDASQWNPKSVQILREAAKE